MTTEIPGFWLDEAAEITDETLAMLSKHVHNGLVQTFWLETSVRTQQPGQFWAREKQK